ncbi:MAG: hypothetical protein LBJ83_03610 [Oscillospiraceae bacterium]|nr:hypothetical protein [Oscillospiraceae bacterium]
MEEKEKVEVNVEVEEKAGKRICKRKFVHCSCAMFAVSLVFNILTIAMLFHLARCLKLAVICQLPHPHHTSFHMPSPCHCHSHCHNHGHEHYHEHEPEEEHVHSYEEIPPEEISQEEAPPLD